MARKNMTPKFDIKKGDNVLIIAGDDRKKEGEVLQMLPKESKVVVKGVNLVKKAIKPTEENPKGGFEFVERPIHISNVKKVEG